MDELAKQLYSRAEKLSKYVRYQDGKCFKKGVLMKDQMQREEYVRRFDEMIQPLDKLDAQTATRLSDSIRNKYKDAAMVVQRLKTFAELVETQRNQTQEQPVGEPKVHFVEVLSRFEKLEGVFTGQRLQDVFSDDLYHRQCEEIEILLGGEGEGNSKKRYVGQEDQLNELANLLRSIVPTRAESHTNQNPNAAPPMTARGVGPSMPNTARGGPSMPATVQNNDPLLTQRTTSRVSTVPKCIANSAVPGVSLYEAQKTSRGTVSMGDLQGMNQSPVYPPNHHMGAGPSNDLAPTMVASQQSTYTNGDPFVPAPPPNVFN